jgi:hypothetical protein
VLGQALAFLTFLLGQHAISGKHLNVSLSDPGVARAVVGCGMFLSAFALIGLALGFTIRHTAGAVAALFGLFFLSPMLLAPFGDGVTKFGLQSVFEGLGTTVASAGADERLGATGGFVTLAGYLAVTLSLAALTLTRRDA